MPFKIIGISGSPVKKGNTAALLSAVMNQAEEKGLETETIALAQQDIRHCTHCNFCLSKQTPGQYCAHRDDAQALYEKLEAADIIVLASPVYFMRTSGMTATFIDPGYDPGNRPRRHQPHGDLRCEQPLRRGGV